MTILPLINPFSTPYEHWQEREPTFDEMKANIKNGKRPSDKIQERLIETVSTAFDAAKFMLKSQADNAFANHIERIIKSDKSYHDHWMPVMDNPTNLELDKYQSEYPCYDLDGVIAHIELKDLRLSKGQFLFHGGVWPSSTKSMRTERPFSTSFCPQVALRNLEFGGKAYEASTIQLWVVEVDNPQTLVYPFHPESDKGHELEVLFSRGAELTLNRRALLPGTYTTYMENNKRDKPMEILHVLIS